MYWEFYMSCRIRIQMEAYIHRNGNLRIWLISGGSPKVWSTQHSRMHPFELGENAVKIGVIENCLPW